MEQNGPCDVGDPGQQARGASPGAVRRLLRHLEPRCRRAFLTLNAAASANQTRHDVIRQELEQRHAQLMVALDMWHAEAAGELEEWLYEEEELIAEHRATLQKVGEALVHAKEVVTQSSRSRHDLTSAAIALEDVKRVTFPKFANRLNNQFVSPPTLKREDVFGFLESCYVQDDDDQSSSGVSEISSLSDSEGADMQADGTPRYEAEVTGLTDAQVEQTLGAAENVSVVTPPPENDSLSTDFAASNRLSAYSAESEMCASLLFDDEDDTGDDGVGNEDDSHGNKGDDCHGNENVSNTAQNSNNNENGSTEPDAERHAATLNYVSHIVVCNTTDETPISDTPGGLATVFIKTSIPQCPGFNIITSCSHDSTNPTLSNNHVESASSKVYDTLDVIASSPRNRPSDSTASGPTVTPEHIESLPQQSYHDDQITSIMIEPQAADVSEAHLSKADVFIPPPSPPEAADTSSIPLHLPPAKADSDGGIDVTEATNKPFQSYCTHGVRLVTAPPVIADDDEIHQTNVSYVRRATVCTTSPRPEVCADITKAVDDIAVRESALVSTESETVTVEAASSPEEHNQNRRPVIASHGDVEKIFGNTREEDGGVDSPDLKNLPSARPSSKHLFELQELDEIQLIDCYVKSKYRVKACIDCTMHDDGCLYCVAGNAVVQYELAGSETARIQLDRPRAVVSTPTSVLCLTNDDSYHLVRLTTDLNIIDKTRLLLVDANGDVVTESDDKVRLLYCADGTLLLWLMKTGKIYAGNPDVGCTLCEVLSLSGVDSDVTGVAVTPGRLLLVTWANGVLEEHDLHTGTVQQADTVLNPTDVCLDGQNNPVVGDHALHVVHITEDYACVRALRTDPVTSQKQVEVCRVLVSPDNELIVLDSLDFITVYGSFITQPVLY